MASSFASTRWSQVLAAGSADSAEARAALTWLCERQWTPLVRQARRWGLGAEAAEDAVQDFCCRLIERRADLGGLDPAAGRFRAWLLTVFRNFLRDRQAHEAAAKRGGGSRKIDPALAACTTPVSEPDFDRDWAEVLLSQALDRLEREHAGDAPRFAALKPFLSGSPDPGAYAAAGRILGLGEGAIKVAVYRLRQRLRELLRQAVAETLASPSPEAIDDEMQALMTALMRPR
jgi:RNA polymerase sigma-70 factor (ECF subfamily)